MSTQLIFVLPGIVLALFFLNLYFKEYSPQTSLLFILTFLPLMDLKVTNEAWGGFKMFDAICFASFIFYFGDFTTLNLRNRTNFYFILFLILAFIIIISGLSSDFPEKTFLVLLKTLPVFIFARFLMSESIKDPSFHLKAIYALKVGIVSALAFLGIQLIVGLKFTFYPALGPNTIDPVFKIIRYPGVFYDSQAHGQFLAMGGFVLLYISQLYNKSNWVNYALFVAVVIGINMAGSRAAFGGMALGLLISFFVAAKRYRIVGLIVMVIAYFTFTLVTYDSPVLNRAKNFSEDLKFRAGLWQDAIAIVKKNPVIGIGSGNYQEYVIRYDQDQYLEIEDGKLMYFDQPESGYLKLMVELGILGFAVFALYLIIPIFKGFILWFNGSVNSRIVFLIGGLISWMVAFTTVYSIFDYRILIFMASLTVFIVSHPRLNERSGEA